MAESLWLCRRCQLLQPRSSTCTFCGVFQDELAKKRAEKTLARASDSLNVAAIENRRSFITKLIRSEFADYLSSRTPPETAEEVRNRVRQLAYSDSSGVNLSSLEKDYLFRECIDELLGLGPLEIILRDPEVREVRVNTTSEVEVREFDGSTGIWDVGFASDEQFRGVVDVLVKEGVQLKLVDPGHTSFMWKGWKATVSERSLNFRSSNDDGEPLLVLELADSVFASAEAPQLLDPSEQSLDERSQEKRSTIGKKRRFIASHIRSSYPQIDTGTFSDEIVEKSRKRIRQLVFGDSSGGALTDFEKGILWQECLDELFGYGPIGPVLRDPKTLECRVYPDGRIAARYSEGDAFESLPYRFDDGDHINRVLSRLVKDAQPRSGPHDDRDEFVLPEFGIRLSVRRPPVPEDMPCFLVKIQYREEF